MFDVLNTKRLISIFALMALTHVQAADIVAQNYAAAKSPSVNSVCTKGYNLLAGDVSYGKTLINGNLPYSISYNAPLRQNLTSAQSFAQPEFSNAGWTDNYKSYVLTQNISSRIRQYQNANAQFLGYVSGYQVYNLSTYNSIEISSMSVKEHIVRLPGESSDTVFKEENGYFSRLYSADPIRDFNNNSVGSLPWSSNLGEYKLERVSGTLKITKLGVVYTVSDTQHTLAPSATSSNTIQYVHVNTNNQVVTSSTYWNSYFLQFGVASNSAPYLVSDTTTSQTLQRISKIQSSGKEVNLSYDSKLNLTQVQDSFNNTLTFERKHNESSQTTDESRLVTKVTYTSGVQGDSQTADLVYTSYDGRVPSNGNTTKLYTLTSAVSTSTSVSNYIYTPIQLGAVPLYVSSKGRTADDSYRYPVLTETRNALNQLESKWEITQNYVVSGSTYGTAKTTLKSYGYSGSANVGETTSIYDDNAKTIQLSFSPDGISNATTTVSTTVTNDSDITINVTGAPCLLSSSTPVSSMRFNTSRSQMLEVTDAKGTKTEVAYDNLNRVTQVKEAVGKAEERITTYTYGVLSDNTPNPFMIPSTVTTPLMTITNVINPLGQITQQTQSSSQANSTSKVTGYTYNALGQMTVVNGPLAGDVDKVTLTYDTYGNKASESQVINGITRRTRYFNYNSFAQPERIVSPNGLVDQFIYNPDGSLQQKNHGTGGTTGTISGQTTSYTYDALKRVLSVTNPDGETTSYTYDNLGRVTKTTLPDGNAVHKGYHPNGVVSAEATRNSANTIFLLSYQDLDVNGRVAKVRSGSNASLYWEAYSYDANGNKTQSTSSLGIIQTWTFDALNRVTSHTDGENNTNTKSYDLEDNVTSAKDAMNSGSSPLEYINGKVLKKEVNADFSTKTYSYDAADRMTQILHNIRQCSFGNLDALGRASTHTCIQSTTGAPSSNTYVHDYAYTYDTTRFGRLESANSVGNLYGTDTSYTYDAYDRVISKTQNVRAISQWNGTQPNRTVSYAYSIGGKLTGLTLPSGRQITYSYDTTGKGQLAGISLNGTSLIDTIVYNGAGQTTSWNWGNDSVYSINYDSSKNGNIKTITNSTSTGTANYKANYIFDADGRIVAITGLVTRDRFVYDNTNQVTNESREYVSGQTPIFGITYTYDKNGNRLSLAATGTHQQPAANVTYTYKANSNRLAMITRDGVTTTPVHINEGELRLDFVSGYDSFGQRRWSGKRNGDSTQPEYYFAYNHKRERTVRSITNNGASWSANAIQYVYDESSHLIGEYKSDGTALVEYVWSGDVPIAAIYGQGSATKIYYIVTDAQNTPRRLIDSSNNAVVWAWDSSAFGVAPPSIETVKFNLRFPGQYYDEITKQHYNLNRYYNPEIGRYMEADPIGLEGGLNPYAYAGSNPVMNVDPSGLEVLLNEKAIGAGTSKGIMNTIMSIGGHFWLDITPNNPDQIRFLHPNIPMKDNRFTIGGYPESNIDLSIRGSSRLIFQFNGDYHSTVRQSYVIDPPSAFNERASSLFSADTLFISALIRGAQNFNNNYINYHGTAGELSLPKFVGAGRIDIFGNYYNSNSFASGLLESVGVNLNIDPWGYQPGFDKPVPEYNFDWMK